MFQDAAVEVAIPVTFKAACIFFWELADQWDAFQLNSCAGCFVNLAAFCLPFPLFRQELGPIDPKILRPPMLRFTQVVSVHKAKSKSYRANWISDEHLCVSPF